MWQQINKTDFICNCDCDFSIDVANHMKVSLVERNNLQG